ncbi:RecF/RecN/SMC family protein [Halomonas alkaliantarctica]|nr:RecF/RecN/SMC family protein [Halomonas alkaliantarctica]
MIKTGTAAGPTTLEDWLNTRASWLRMAADGVIKHRRMPTEDELEALTVHCLDEASKSNTKHPALSQGVILGTIGAGALRINSLTAIRGVNAIGADAALDFSQGDMTVVYGANGSGKSGYARLMKHVCGARAKGTIHSNVFDETARAAASAQVNISTLRPNEESPITSDLQWEAIAGSHPKLNAIPVFDSATALELGDTASTATHLPRAMRFVGVLIRISDSVNERLKGRSAQLISQLPVVPSAYVHTTAGNYFQKLKHNLSDDAISKACAFPETARQERLALEAALAQPNPGVAHAKAVGDLERLDKLNEIVAKLIESLSNERAESVIAARKISIEKREAATEYAKSFINGMPLKGVGEPVWQTLWEAAKAYSTVLAYPNHTHPYDGEDARCVLCQQPLESEGKERLLSFEQYLTDTLQNEAKAAESALASLVEALPSKLDGLAWQSQFSTVGLDTAKATMLVDDINARLEAINHAVDLFNIPSVDWMVWADALSDAVTALTAKRDALASLLDPAGRAQKETHLRELSAQEWLAGQVDAVKAEVLRLKLVATHQDAIQLTLTRTLTIKSNEIGETELAQGFCDRFNAELKALGGNALPVQMSHRATGKGAYSFYIELKDTTTTVKSREILSEGEQRIVALAAFLADATGTDRGLPVIFDDPISSLDQRFEETVAKRLVDLAKDRQVIVFTHRLSLMVLLGNAASQRLSVALSPVNVHVQSIGRDGASTGMPASIDIFSLKPMTGFNQMINNVGAFKKYDAPLRALALKDACSNFRILVERSVEDHLCSGIINRYRREIHTQGKLKRLNAITPEDCTMINEMMTKYSAFEHSQPMETPTWLPTPDELLVDLQTMVGWIKNFEKRAKEAAKS